MQRFLFFLFGLIFLSTAACADTVLVLPFFSLSPSEENLDWISESISETIREGLYSRGFLVVDRQDRHEVYRRLSIRRDARLTRASIIKVGEALDASTVVYGQFEFLPEDTANGNSRGSLRIVTYLLDTKRMKQGPPFTETGPLENLGKLQTHVTWEVLRAIAPKNTPSELEFARALPPVRLDAMENYVRGLLATEPDQKHRYFTQAVRLDENFSKPSFELGRLYWRKKEYRLAGEWFSKVKPENPSFLEATFFLGLCHYFTADYEKSASAFQLVATSIPLNEVLNDLGAAQSRRNLPEALDSFRKALEGDTADPDYHFNVGYALWKRGDFKGAAERFRAVLERNPEDSLAVLMLGKSLSNSGPRPGDPKSEGLERVKQEFEERAYRELKAAVEGGK